MNKKILLGLLLLAFILPRIFVASPFYFVSMDEAKYLALTSAFPHHTLFNDQIYVVHPPLFPYLIRLFTVALPDHTAGIAVSLLFAVVTFFAMVKLFGLLGKGSCWITIAMFILVVSPLHIPTSRVVYKDSMFLGLFLLSLGFYIRGLVAGRDGWLWGAGVCGAACCLTSDLGVYLFPCFVLGYLVFRKPGARLRSVSVPFLLAFIPYAAWLLVRFILFKSNAYYPAGVDGTIESVGEVTLRQLFTPRYFPVTSTMFDFGFDLTHFGLHGNCYPLCPLLNFSSYWRVAFYSFVALTAFFAVVRAIVKKDARNNPAFFFSIMLVLCVLPVVFHPEPRFLIPVLLPMAYLFAEGVALIASRIPGGTRPLKYVAWALVIVLLIGSGMYVAWNRHSIFTLEKEVEGNKTARYLESLPGEGVMAQVGYPPELAYLTGKRVIALPVSPEKLDYFIRLYDIHYLLYGRHYWGRISAANAPNIWCYETIKYIRDNPDRYPLLNAVDEEFKSVSWPDRVFIHSVRQD